MEERIKRAKIAANEVKTTFAVRPQSLSPSPLHGRNAARAGRTWAGPNRRVCEIKQVMLVLDPQVKAKIKEPEFEVPAGASPAHAKALRKKARMAAKKDALQVLS